MANNNNNLTRSKRLAVRTAIVTASTVATIVGAQSLALMDMRSPTITTKTVASVPTQAAALTTATTNTQTVNTQTTNTATTNTQTTNTTSIIHTAPTIVVVEESGSTGATTTQNTTTIAPPQAQIDQTASTTNNSFAQTQPTYSQPSIIQFPSISFGRSSR